MTPDRIFTDARLAAVYDAVNPPGDEVPFLLALASSHPMRVLDVGCGTGRLAVAFAESGHDVTGLDPAQAMLTEARRRPGGDGVRWIRGEAQAFDLPTRFDLAVMTGNVFQVFLTDDDARAALATILRHLAPDGRLVFETRNPAAREWGAWNPIESIERIEVPGLGEIEVWWEVTDDHHGLVTFQTHHRFLSTGEHEVAASTLRFRPRDDVGLLLEEAGYASVTWVGDWDGSSVSPISPEFIAIAHAGAA